MSSLFLISSSLLNSSSSLLFQELLILKAYQRSSALSTFIRLVAFLSLYLSITHFNFTTLNLPFFNSTLLFLSLCFLFLFLTHYTSPTPEHLIPQYICKEGDI